MEDSENSGRRGRWGGGIGDFVKEKGDSEDPDRVHGELQGAPMDMDKSNNHGVIEGPEIDGSAISNLDGVEIQK